MDTVLCIRSRQDSVPNTYITTVLMAVGIITEGEEKKKSSKD